MWVRAWMELGRDFYEAHYYPAAEGESTLAESLPAVERLERPLWLGELPARDPSVPGYRLADALNCRNGQSGRASRTCSSRELDLFKARRDEDGVNLFARRACSLRHASGISAMFAVK